MPIVAFFAIAYAIGWGLMRVFNAVDQVSGLEEGFILMAMTESLELEIIAAQLPVPGWFLYLLSRVQGFSFTITGLIMTDIVTGRAGFAILGKKFRPGLAGVRWYVAALVLPYGLWGRNRGYAALRCRAYNYVMDR